MSSYPQWQCFNCRELAIIHQSCWDCGMKTYSQDWISEDRRGTTRPATELEEVCCHRQESQVDTRASKTQPPLLLLFEAQEVSEALETSTAESKVNRNFVRQDFVLIKSLSGIYGPTSRRHLWKEVTSSTEQSGVIKSSQEHKLQSDRLASKEKTSFSIYIHSRLCLPSHLS